MRKFRACFWTPRFFPWNIAHLLLVSGFQVNNNKHFSCSIHNYLFVEAVNKTLRFQINKRLFFLRIKSSNRGDNNKRADKITSQRNWCFPLFRLSPSSASFFLHTSFACHVNKKLHSFFEGRFLFYVCWTFEYVVSIHQKKQQTFISSHFSISLFSICLLFSGFLAVSFTFCIKFVWTY